MKLVIIAAWTSQVFCLSNFILVFHDRKPCHVLQKVVVWEFDFKKSQTFNHQNASDHRPAMLSKFELCIKDILIWCTSNGLACNPDKTEIVHLTSRHSKHHFEIPGIVINDATIAPRLAARNLGVTVDSHLQMTNHVNNICKSAFFAIRNIGKIRKYLSQVDCERLVHAFITSKLDSYNSILFGLPPKLWNSLPVHIRTSDSLSSFKSLLKTHLFCDYFHN